MELVQPEPEAVELTLEEKVDLLLENDKVILTFIHSLNAALEVMAENPMLKTLGFSLPTL